MGEHEVPPKRWIITKFWEHAVERTEAQIEELKAQGFHVRDASGPDDVHVPAAPVPVPAGAPVTTPAGPPAGAKPDDKKEP